MRKMSEKYNEACIKIFDMLKLLSKGTAHYDDIIELFDGEESNGSASHVILNKYLNTLKIFGINVYKSKNIYHLQNSFFSINLNDNEIKLLQKLKNTSSHLSNQKQKELFNEFIKDIERRLTNSSQELLNNELSDSTTKNSTYKDLLEQFENACFENTKLEISFEVGTKTHKVICTPKETNYSNGKYYFAVFNHINRQNFEIPVEKIRAIKILPTISNYENIQTTVVFQIKGSLAKSYQLKEGETSNGEFDKDGWLTIISRKETTDDLIKRLMRYNSNCRIISPKHVKERMISTIDDTLANYL